MNTSPRGAGFVAPRAAGLTAAGSHAGTAQTADGVSIVWRGIVLVSLIGLLSGMRAVWNAEIWGHLGAGLIVTAVYAGIFGCAIAAVSARAAAAMRRVEYSVLSVAVVLYLAELPRWFSLGATGYANDEGTLTDLAGSALRRGADPYAQSWPHAFDGWARGMTQTMSGHVVTRFDYPPVALILSATVKSFTHRLPAAGIVAALALLALTVLMFFLLPSPWRCAAPLICVGLGFYLPVARLGYPTIVALPLLVLAFSRWTSIGAGGRLGWRGWGSAGALGLAAATEQVTWFAIPFLLVAIVLIRRADLTWRASLTVTGAYLAVASAAFAVVNAPFALWNPGDWLAGIVAPLTQGAVPHGQGLVDVSFYLLRGSGAMNFYSYAALAYGLALLICYALYIRRLGLAVAILPWTIFFFSVRSEDGYFVLPVVVWVVSVITADRAAIERAHQPGSGLRGRRFASTRTRAAAAGACFLPALALVAVAIGTPPSLRLRVAPVTAGRTGGISHLTVTVTNTSGHQVAPNFSLSQDEGTTPFWIITSGPAALRPGTTATYDIRAPWPAARPRSTTKLIELRVFSGGPATLSSTVVRHAR
jgi:hypothetical protein